jgi:3-methyladenine DNA glycosylase/8-oxoguanine DNA glycosylase
MLRRLLDRFGGQLPTPEQLLAANPQDLRAAQLSHCKVQTLRELAERFVDGRLDPAELARPSMAEFTRPQPPIPLPEGAAGREGTNAASV